MFEESHARGAHYRISSSWFLARTRRCPFRTNPVSLSRRPHPSRVPIRLTLLTSTFFRNNNGELYRETCDELRRRGAAVAAHKTHAKVVTLDFGRAKLSVEGSANLRSNRSIEQVMLARHGALHDWHAAWIDSFVADHQGDGAGADDGEEGEQGGPG
jgi:hypothetical protein